jgi:hypothetical protein
VSFSCSIENITDPAMNPLASSSPENAQWTLDEFVERLNEQAPLPQGEDGRRASAWTPRLVRHYATQKALSAPEKIGRQAYYGPQHLEEARRLTAIQQAGGSTKTAAIIKDEASDLASSLLYAASPDAEALAAAAVAPLSLDSLPAASAPKKTIEASAALLANLSGSSFAAAAPLSASRERALGLLNEYSKGSPSAGASLAKRSMAAPARAAFAGAALSGLESVAGAPQEAGWRRFSPAAGVEMWIREEHWPRAQELARLLEAWARGEP